MALRVSCEAAQEQDINEQWQDLIFLQVSVGRMGSAGMCICSHNPRICTLCCSGAVLTQTGFQQLVSLLLYHSNAGGPLDADCGRDS